MAFKALSMLVLAVYSEGKLCMVMTHLRKLRNQVEAAIAGQVYVVALGRGRKARNQKSA